MEESKEDFTIIGDKPVDIQNSRWKTGHERKEAGIKYIRQRSSVEVSGLTSSHV
jgi:hypothetical protein